MNFNKSSLVNENTLVNVLFAGKLVNLNPNNIDHLSPLKFGYILVFISGTGLLVSD